MDIAASVVSRMPDAGLGLEGYLNDFSTDIKDLLEAEEKVTSERYKRSGAADYSLGQITSTGAGLTGRMGFKKGELIFDLKPFEIGKEVIKGAGQALEVLPVAMLAGPGGMYYHSLYKGMIKGEGILF